MYSDGLKRYLEQKNKTPATYDLLSNPNAADILKQYRESTLAAVEDQRRRQAESAARGQQIIASAQARAAYEQNSPLSTLNQNASGNAAGKNMFMNRVGNTATAAITRQTAADAAAQEARRAETVDNPEWLNSLRSEADIQADLNAAKKENTRTWWQDTFANWGARLTNAVNQSNIAVPTVEEPGYARTAETTKKVRQFKDELAERQWADFEKLRNNSDFAEKSLYKSTANGKTRKLGVNGYENIPFDDLEYEYVNGVQEAGEILEHNKVQQSLGKGIKGALTAPKEYEYQHLSEMTDDERALYNYIHEAQGPEKAHEYLEFLRSDLYRRQAEKEKAQAAAYAEKHPVLSTVETIGLSPLRGMAYAEQVSDYIKNGEIDPNAPSQRISHLPKAARETVTRTVERNWGKVGSFAYGVGVSMAEFLLNSAVTGFGADKAAQNLSLLLMGSGAAADATIEAKERGLSDNQSFALGTMAGLAEIVTEKVSVENLFSGKWEKEPLRYLLKNTIAEGSEEAASDLINWFADVLISRDKSEWQNSINAYKKQGLSEKDAFYAAIKDKGTEIITDAAAGALSGFLMAAGPSARGMYSEIKYPVSSKIGLEENREERFGTINASIQNALEVTESDRMEALADYVYEMEQSFPHTRKDGTLDATRQAIRYLQETVKITTDSGLKESLKELESDLRNNQYKIEARVGELNEIRGFDPNQAQNAPAAERTAEDSGEEDFLPDDNYAVMAKSKDEWGFLPEDNYAQRQGESNDFVSRIVARANKSFEDTVTTIADSPAENLVQETADLVTKVAETTEPDADVIRETIDKVNEGIKTINKVVNAVENQYSENLYTWLNSEETRQAFPMIADIQDRTPQNLLPSTTQTYQDLKAGAPEAYRQYILNEMKIRRAVLEQIDSVLRNQKQDVKQAVTDILTQSATSALTEGENGGTLEETPAVNPVIQADGESLAPVKTETPAEGQPKYTLTHSDYTHTKTGEKMHLFQTSERMSDEDYKKFQKYWSKFAKGFLVKTSKLDEFRNLLKETNTRVDGFDFDYVTDNAPQTQQPVNQTPTTEPEVPAQTTSEKTSSVKKWSPKSKEPLTFENFPYKDGTLVNQVYAFDPSKIFEKYIVEHDKDGAILFEPGDTPHADLIPYDKLEHFIRTDYYNPTNIVEPGAVEEFNELRQNGEISVTRETSEETPAETQPEQEETETKPEPKKKREPVAPTPKKTTQRTETDYDVLSDRLMVSQEVKMHGLIFSISDFDGNFRGEIKKQSEFNGAYPIENARDTIYRQFYPNSTREKVVEGLVGVAENNKLFEYADRNKQTEATVDNSPEQGYTETGTAAEAVSEYAVGDILEYGGEYYEVVSIENGEPQLAPYTSTEAETAYNAGDIIEYNGKSYKIVEFDENGDAVLQEYRPPKNSSSGVSYALGEPERITLSAADFKKAVSSNQIRKVTSAGTQQTASGTRSGTRPSGSTAQRAPATGRISLSELQKNGTAGTTFTKITDKSSLKGIVNGKKVVNPAPAARKPKTESNTVKEKGNENEGLRGADSGRNEGDGGSNRPLGGEGADGDGGRASGPVQEAQKAEGSERGSGQSWEGVRSDGGRTGEVADGARNAGEDVRAEPVPSAESDAGGDERGDGAGNGGRAAERPSGSSGGNGNSRVTLNRNKYTFDADDISYINSTKPRFDDNISAIRILKDIEASGRAATPEEKKILARYKGWGGLANAFNTWTKEYKSLSELLTREELEAARASTTNAHYTDLEVVSAIYDGLKRMGLKGGNILEPSMGTGNFFGAMPKALANKSNLFGVEMDSLTGRIAKVLYPDANIMIAPFQNARYEDGQFDAIVGNVPFSEVTYPYKGKKYTLHDYFFVKGLDHLKPGGIMMAITSTGTLDSGSIDKRNALAGKADLIAAFRLPGGMFETNAGTKVTTDLLVFRKRPEGLAQSAETFSGIGTIEAYNVDTGETQDASINEYYVRHPENILGESIMDKGMYRDYRLQARPFAGADYRDILAQAMKRLPANIMNTDMTADEVRIRNDSLKSGLTETDGKIYFKDALTGDVTPWSGKKADMARDYMKIRDAYLGLINLSTQANADPQQLESVRRTLNAAYDAFVGKYGNLLQTGNGRPKSVLQGDSYYNMVASIEQKGKEKGTFEKSPILTQNTFRKPRVEHVDTAHDALAVSLAEKGKIDFDYMTELSGMSKTDLLEQLGDSVFETPDGDYQFSEVYLSGNVREKLARAREAAEQDRRFERNVKALEAVMPQDVPAQNISVTIGASWIPVDVYRDFVREVFRAEPKISRNSQIGGWVVEGYAGASRKYGDVNVRQFLESTMNQRMIKIKVKGKLDAAATQEIQEKQKQLRNEFAAWIFANSDRRAALETLYNEKYNSWHGADYSKLADALTFDGKNPGIDLRDYQKTAIARAVFGGNTLLAHGVGTGKTFETIATAMESKRLGITHKNLFVVPKNKVYDFQRDILKLYPNARIMIADDSDFKKENRPRMIASLAANDYDIAVIGHSQFAFIPLSPETERATINQQLEEYRAILEEEAGPSTDEYGRRIRKQKSRSVKDIEKAIARLEARLEELQVKRRDNTLTFEQLGIDGLFVDEAHNFKNLPFATTLNVQGVKNSDAQRAGDMFAKTNYLHSKGGRIVFATATPITNSMSELYNMTRFVSPETFRDAGIQSFDDWANTFGEVVSGLEVSPDGVHFRIKDRFAKFKNAQQMLGLFHQYADIKKTEEVIKELPKAVRIDVTCGTNDMMQEYIGEIAHRIDSLKFGSAATDNMLLITSDGKAAATDLRLIADQLHMDPRDLDLPGSKINRTVENVLREYKDTKKTKGVQLVFLDMGLGTNNKRYNFNLYSDLIGKLIKGGIKPEEIVRIDAVAPKDLDELFTRVKAGDVRVLIGSNARMGEGLNVQDKIVAMHEVMPTNKPSEIQQSEGRAIRYGNENPEVRIYRYIQEGSFDSYMWQQLERKARFVNVAMSKGDVSEIEDVDDFVLSAAEGKALATGNPLLLEKAELDNKYTELSAAYRVYQEQQFSARATIDEATKNIRRLEAAQAGHREDMRKINAAPETHFEKGVIPAEGSPFIIKGKEYRDHKAINEAIARVLKSGIYALHSHHVVGSLRGIDIEFNPEPSMNYLLIKFGGGDRTLADITVDGDNAIRILNAIDGAPKAGEAIDNALDYQRSQLKDAQAIYGKPFDQQAEYDATVSRLQQVNAELFEKAGGDFDFIDEEDPNLQGGDFDSEDDGANQYSLGESKGIFGNGRHDANAEVPSISDLWDEAKKTFKIPINTGRMGNVPKTAHGIFKEQPETIRTRRYGSLPTLAHEIGHWYDKKYKLRKNAAVREISAAFEDELRAKGYSTKQIPGESVAEYFRAYMENSELTERRFPKFTNWMTGQVSDTDLKRLTSFSEKSNAYFGADMERRAEVQVHYRADEAVPVVHSPVNVQAIKEDPYGYFGGKAKAFSRAMADDIRDLRGVGRAYDLAFLAKRANSIAASRLKYSMTDLNGNTVGDGLAPILADAGIENPETRRKFDEYLIARRALDHFEANKRGENLPTLVYAEEELNSEESLVERIQQMEDAFPSFHDASERLYTLQNQMLDLAVDSGLMTEEKRARLNELYPHYVPLYRVMDDAQVKSVTGSKMMSNNSPIAHFKGSMRDIYSPIENIMVNMAKYTSMSITAQIKRQIYDFAMQEGMGWFAEEVPASKILDYVTTDEIRKKLDALKTNEEALETLTGEKREEVLDEIMNLIGDSTSQWKIKTKQGTNIMPVMVDGQVHYLEIHDENLMKSIAGLEPKQYGWLTQQMGNVTRFEKNFFTGVNVKFAFTNVARDLATGYASSTTTNNPIKYLADFGKAFWSSMREDEAYQNFQLQGGGYMGAYTSDYNRMKKLHQEIVGNDAKGFKRILKTAFDMTLGNIPRIIDAGENASRQAEFYRAIDKGFDNLDAFRMSQEVTVNFDRGGNAVKAINQWIPYRQAAANSLYHMIDLFSTGGTGGRNASKSEMARNRRNFIIKWIGSQAFMAMLTTLLSYGIARILKKETKEQVYEARENLSKYRKNNYWNVYIGDGKFFEIRKETMMNTPINVIERLIEYSALEQGDALDGMAQDLVDAWLPLDIFDPLGDIAGSTSVVGTVYDLVSNKDFKGTPIVSSQYQKRPNEEQYSDSTSEIWKGVGSIFNASPMQLQYAFEDNFGFYAQTFDRMTSKSGGVNHTDGNILKQAAYRVGNTLKSVGEGTFAADSVYSTDVLNTFYDQKDAYDKGKAGYNANPGSKRYGLEDVLGAYKYGKVADLYTDLNRFVRAENDDDLSREMRKRVNALIAGVNKEGISDLDQAVIDLAESTGAEISDIAPYVVFKDHITAKVNKQNQRFDLSFDDMIAYYTQARKGIEDEYRRILQSGYDDATTADMLIAARKEKDKECEDYWKSVFVERAK